MNVCHCVLPYINPLACKNCNNNNSYKIEEFDFSTIEIGKYDTKDFTKEDFENLLIKGYPKSVPQEDVKENDA